MRTVDYYRVGEVLQLRIINKDTHAHKVLESHEFNMNKESDMDNFFSICVDKLNIDFKKLRKRHNIDWQ